MGTREVKGYQKAADASLLLSDLGTPGLDGTAEVNALASHLCRPWFKCHFAQEGLGSGITRMLRVRNEVDC